MSRSTAPELSARKTRWLLIVAQLCALAALGFGLEFVIHTTGGTLFLFSSMGPVLVAGSSLILLAVAIHRYRKRHSLFEVARFEPGQIIFHEGDAGECAYFIQAGSVEVLQGSGSGELTVARLRAGQYFGEMALLSQAPRNATVRVEERCAWPCRD